MSAEQPNSNLKQTEALDSQSHGRGAQPGADGDAPAPSPAAPVGTPATISGIASVNQEYQWVESSTTETVVAVENGLFNDANSSPVTVAALEVPAWMTEPSANERLWSPVDHDPAFDSESLVAEVGSTADAACCEINTLLGHTSEEAQGWSEPSGNDTDPACTDATDGPALHEEAPSPQVAGLDDLNCAAAFSASDHQMAIGSEFLVAQAASITDAACCVELTGHMSTTSEEGQGWCTSADPSASPAEAQANETLSWPERGSDGTQSNTCLPESDASASEASRSYEEHSPPAPPPEPSAVDYDCAYESAGGH